MSTGRIFCNLLSRSLAYAAKGAIDGAIGGSILAAARKTGYSVLGATQAGAAGGAIVGPLVAILTACLDCCKIKGPADVETLIAEAVISIGTSTLSGVIGHAMLKEISEMSLEKTAEALAVGSSTFIGGVLTLVLVGGCCYCVIGGTIACCLSDSKAKSAPAPLRTMSRNVGSFFPKRPANTSPNKMEAAEEESETKSAAATVIIYPEVSESGATEPKTSASENPDISGDATSAQEVSTQAPVPDPVQAVPVVLVQPVNNQIAEVQEDVAPKVESQEAEAPKVEPAIATPEIDTQETESTAKLRM